MLHRTAVLISSLAMVAGVLLHTTTSAAIATAEPSAGRPPAVVPFSVSFRRCDFGSNTFVPPRGYGRGSALVRAGSGGAFNVDVRLETAVPDTRYDLRLIQAPRPASGGCGAGDPGVSATSLVTDHVGNAMVTLSDTAEPGFTGVWVFISLPDEFSQTPRESYTSDFIAAV